MDGGGWRDWQQQQHQLQQQCRDVLGRVQVLLELVDGGLELQRSVVPLLKNGPLLRLRLSVIVLQQQRGRRRRQRQGRAVRREGEGRGRGGGREREGEGERDRQRREEFMIVPCDNDAVDDDDIDDNKDSNDDDTDGDDDDGGGGCAYRFELGRARLPRRQGFLQGRTSVADSALRTRRKPESPRGRRRWRRG